MSKIKVVIISLLVVSLGFVVYRILDTDTTVVEKTVRAQRRTIERTLAFSGSVSPQKEIDIKSTISGVLQKLSVQVGDDVEIGQDIARVQYVKDPMEYKRLLNELEVAKARVENAQKRFERSSKLHEQKMLTDEDYETQANELQILVTQYDAVASEFDMLQGKYSGLAQTNVITATGVGTILDLPVKEGGSVMARGTLSEGSTIARVADLRSLIFKGQVLESDIAKVENGMPVKYHFTSLPDTVLTGKITLISPRGIVTNGIAQFEIQASIDVGEDLRRQVRAGCTGNAELVIDRRDSVLSLEERYFRFSYDSVFVRVKLGLGVSEKRTIHTGISDGIYTEVLDGIASDDEILITETIQ